MNMQSPLGSSQSDLLCPKCKVGSLKERVPRSKFVKTFLFFLPLKRYKCYKCFKRPYVLDK